MQQKSKKILLIQVKYKDYLNELRMRLIRLKFTRQFALHILIKRVGMESFESLNPSIEKYMKRHFSLN